MMRCPERPRAVEPAPFPQLTRRAIAAANQSRHRRDVRQSAVAPADDDLGPGADGGLDLGGFYRARGERLGVTLLVSGNAQRAYDADDDGFSNLPQTRRLTVKPRLFFYAGGGATLSAGVSASVEERDGGDVLAAEWAREHRLGRQADVMTHRAD